MVIEWSMQLFLQKTTVLLVWAKSCPINSALLKPWEAMDWCVCRPGIAVSEPVPSFTVRGFGINWDSCKTALTIRTFKQLHLIPFWANISLTTLIILHTFHFLITSLSLLLFREEHITNLWKLTKSSYLDPTLHMLIHHIQNWQLITDAILEAYMWDPTSVEEENKTSFTRM